MKKLFKMLEERLNNFLFLLEVEEFIRTRCIADNFNENPEQFMQKFLLMECIGKDYTEEELLDKYKKVKKLLKKESKIDSEKLPILDSTAHSDKLLQNVWYVRVGNTWTYEEKEDCR